MAIYWLPITKKSIFYALAVVAVSVNPAKAEGPISGPGGAGNISRLGDNFGVTEFFTGVGSTKYIDKVFDGLSAGAKYSVDVSVRNDSGITWKDFHFLIINPQVDPVPDRLRNPTSSVFTTVTTPPFGGSTVDWAGGTVGDDNSLDFDDVFFTFDYIATRNGSLTVRQYATTTVPAPLPCLGLGVAFGYSRKLRKRIMGSKSLSLAGAFD